MNCERKARRVSGWTVLVFLFAAVGTSSPARSAEDEQPGDAEKAARQKSLTNLKQLALYMHNHNDTIGHLPPAALTDNNGKPLLSWRVALLPFIEENGQYQDKLYKEFRLDEPWECGNETCEPPAGTGVVEGDELVA